MPPENQKPDLLARLQNEFMAGVLSKDTTILGEIKQDHLTPEQHMQIYRNNAVLILAANLAEKFPVLVKLVGDEFFTQMASQFAQKQPPKSGDLTLYGAGFADFVQKYNPAQDLVYLSDVARLEWAYYSRQYEAPAASLGAAELGQVQRPLEEVQLHLHPSCILLRSPYPIDQIYQQNQPDNQDDAEINLDSGSAFLLISHPAEDTLVWSLSKGEYYFLNACKTGNSIAAASQIADAADPEFDTVNALSHHLSGGTFAKFTSVKT